MRAVLFSLNPKLIYGDYTPCEIGEGLLVRVRREGYEKMLKAEWTKARTEEVKQGFKPPYLEYHFRAVALGAYPVSVFKGYAPKVGVADKYWNVIKYVDVSEENLLAPLVVGLKTWHYTVLDGTRVGTKRYQTYEVVKVRHVVYLEDVYGFALVDDPVIANAMLKLMEGWFIVKSRLKTLIALRVEELLEQVSRVEKVDYLVPMLTKPRKPTYSFTTAVLSLDALAGKRVDASAVKGYLHTTTESSEELDKLVLFKSRDGAVYGVDKEWLKYMERRG